MIREIEQESNSKMRELLKQKKKSLTVYFSKVYSLFLLIFIEISSGRKKNTNTENTGENSRQCKILSSKKRERSGYSIDVCTLNCNKY